MLTRYSNNNSFPHQVMKPVVMRKRVSIIPTTMMKPKIKLVIYLELSLSLPLYRFLPLRRRKA